MLLIGVAIGVGVLCGLGAGPLTMWAPQYRTMMLLLCGAGAGALVSVFVTRLHERRVWLASLAGGLAGLVCAVVAAAFSGYLRRHGFSLPLFLHFDLRIHGLGLCFAPATGGVMAAQAARKPYCTRCNAWAHCKGKRHVSKEARPEVKAAIDSGDLAALVAIPETGDSHDPLLTLYTCPTCNQGFLTYESDRYKGNVKRYELTEEATAWLVRIF
jgi:hypothetical protein